MSSNRNCHAQAGNRRCGDWLSYAEAGETGWLRGKCCCRGSCCSRGSFGSFLGDLVQPSSLRLKSDRRCVALVGSKRLLSNSRLMRENVLSCCQFSSSERERRGSVRMHRTENHRGQAHRHILHRIRRPETTTSALVPIFSTDTSFCVAGNSLVLLSAAAAGSCSALAARDEVVKRFRAAGTSMRGGGGAGLSGDVGGDTTFGNEGCPSVDGDAAGEASGEG